MKKFLFAASLGLILALGTHAAALAAPSSDPCSGAPVPGYAPCRCTRTAACLQAQPPSRQEEEPSSQPAPADETLARRMLTMVNEDRARSGLDPLAWSDALAGQALLHSRDMVSGGFFSHSSPSRGGFSQRLAASGISVLGAGENLALYGSLEKAQAALMSSQGHRANILNPNYTHCGIGIVFDGDRGGYCITQWFARLP